MSGLALHDFHASKGATFGAVNGLEIAEDYGSVLDEYKILHGSAGVVDLSTRGRICLAGEDRIRFLHGQITNDVKSLEEGGGCYAALVSNKGKIQSDLNVYRLENELLLDFEPGLTQLVTERLEHFIVADDVEVVDVAGMYSLLSFVGPRSGTIIADLFPDAFVPAREFSIASMPSHLAGDFYVSFRSRAGLNAYDCFIPTPVLADFSKLVAAALADCGGAFCGWQALEICRIEAGIPRFGKDMTEQNLAPEGRIEDRAISYNKGCYIGQEIINRLHSFARVAKTLQTLALPSDETSLPRDGAKISSGGKDVGYVTSSTHSPKFGHPIVLGYVRRELGVAGSSLEVHMPGAVPVSATVMG